MLIPKNDGITNAVEREKRVDFLKKIQSLKKTLKWGYEITK